MSEVEAAATPVPAETPAGGPAGRLSGRRRVWLGAVLFAGLALRVVFWLPVAQNPERVFFLSFRHNDAHGYHRLAVNLLEGRGFSQSRSAPYEPDFIRTPAYPGFLAACYFVFGRRALVALFFQALMGALAVFCCWRLAARHGFGAGVIAAAFLAFDAPSVLWGSFLITEALASLLVIASVCVWSGAGLRRAFLAALLMGLAGLTRPICMYVFAALFLDALLWYRGERRRLGLQRVGALLLGLALTAGPWALRNIVSGGPPGLSGIAENNLLHYRAAGAVSTYHGDAMTLQEARAILDVELARRLPENPTPAQVAAAQRELALETLWEYKGSAVLMVLEGVQMLLSDSDFSWYSYRFWGVRAWQPSISQTFSEQGVFAAWEVLWSRGWTGLLLVVLLGWETLLPPLLYLAVLVGVFRSWKNARVRRSLVLWLACGGILLGLGAGRDAGARIRVPAVPFLALVAGLGLGLPRRRTDA